MYATRLWTAIAFIFGVLPLVLSSTEMWDGVVAIHAMTANDWTAMKGWVLVSGSALADRKSLAIWVR